MKSNSNMKITILMILMSIFVLSPVFISNLNFDNGINDKINLYNENLKSSVISGPIFINGNSGWLNFKNAGKCTGNGSSSDPYIIEDLVINAGGSASCIIIEYSDVYFRIENCTFYNSGTREIDAGLKLRYVINGQIINNTSYDNKNGILITYSDNNTFIGNNIYDDYYGLFVEYCDGNHFCLNNIGGTLHDIFYRFSTFTFNSLEKWIYTYQGKNYTSYLGNYWEGHDGYDRNNDGIADNHKKVLAYITGYDLFDNYPLMEPNWNYEFHRIVDPSEETDNGEKIPGYNLIFLIGIICTISTILHKRLKEITK